MNCLDDTLYAIFTCTLEHSNPELYGKSENLTVLILLTRLPSYCILSVYKHTLQYDSKTLLNGFPNFSKMRPGFGMYLYLIVRSLRRFLTHGSSLKFIELVLRTRSHFSLLITLPIYAAKTKSMDETFDSSSYKRLPQPYTCLGLVRI